MDEPESRWIKRIEWARCGQPQRNEFNSLASMWVEGSISTEELAIELLEMWHALHCLKKHLPDTQRLESHIAVLAECVVAARGFDDRTPLERRDLLLGCVTTLDEGPSNQR